VQNTEPESTCAPQEEQIGRVTVIVAPALLVDMRWPHEVQKLADSSTSLPQDVQSAIHFAPGIFAACPSGLSFTPAEITPYFPAAIFSTSCE
jgi:hypothetical protein